MPRGQAGGHLPPGFLRCSRRHSCGDHGIMPQPAIAQTLGQRRSSARVSERRGAAASTIGLPFSLWFNMPDEAILEALRTALGSYVDPYAGQSLAGALAVRDVKATADGGYTAHIVLGFPVGGYQQELGEALRRHVVAAGIQAPLDRGARVRNQVSRGPTQPQAARADQERRGGRLRQGRCRQIHRSRESGARLGRAGRPGSASSTRTSTAPASP